MSKAKWIALALVMAALGVGTGYWLGARDPAPAMGSAAQGASAPGETKAGRKVLYYRNPMGLSDTSAVPKKDPMGMDYIPVYEGEEPQDAPPGSVKIPSDKVQLLGVRTEAAQVRELKRTVHAVGTIQPNERGLYRVAPRFEGWIEKLQVNTTGQAVSRGQVLMEVYSPELVSAQEEYVVALRGARELKDAGADAQATMQRLADSVLRRLRNWDIAEHELERLQQTGKPERLLAYRSPASGVVLQKPSIAGMRFMPGDVLYEIADLSTVWMIADVSEQDLGLVRAGQATRVRIVAYPGREFAGKLVFVYPALEPSTRTARVRVELPNAEGLLKPAMYGEAEVAAGRAGGKALAVPDSAVLDSGTQQLVLVQRGEGLFEPRAIKLGMRADGYAEVKDGVRAGEQVVVRANFLIDAESNLKSALGSFGHEHGGAQKTAPSAAASGGPHRGTGKVTSVDPKAGTVEIEHQPIASLNWPAMTMAFQARDRSMLGGLKPGQSVDFELSQGKPGEFLIERISPAAGAAAGGAHAGHGGK